ncbi:MAG: isoprenylcysteine carboxylmethyltransferase family protein [Bacteroidota bacterium]
MFISEFIVRIMFAVAFFSVFSFGFYYRLKAQQQQDRFERMKNEGKTTFFILRVSGLILWLIAFVFPWFPDFFAIVRFAPIVTLQIVGIVLSLISIPMGISVFTNIGKNITDTVETRKNHQLVTSGIYRFIRHPLYTTGFLFFVGLGLLSSNWLMLLLSLIVLITLYVRTFTEEQKLIEEFGERYTEYMNTTGKFIPKLF